MYEPDSGWNAVWTGAPEDEPPEGADGNDDDYDGLANWLEDHYGTDRYTPDSDYDGVTDGDEIFLLGTDPLNWDTDGNSYSDADDAYFSAYGHYPWETPDPEPDPDPEDPPPDDPSLAITTTEVPTIMESAPYSFRFTAEGGVGSYTWTLVSGALPGDLSLGSDGTLTGDGGSASEGQYSFEVAVQDSDSNSVSQMFSIIVYWPPDPGDPPVDDPGDSGPDPEADSDSDGVPNGIEWQLDSNAEQWDSMNPGVSDWFYWYFSHLGPSAADPDADGDGLGELLETAIGTSDTHWDSLGTFYGDRHHYYLQVLAQGAPETDSDGDSLGDLLEQTLGMNPQDPDSDGDGFSDADEWANIAYSTPWQWDTDGDGLHDGLEAQIGTQARQVDTDGDHLTDSEEHHGVYGPLDPLLWSTAQNGRPDYMDADLTDSDGGGIPDRLETFWGLNPNNAADEQGDIDADGVTNLEEYMTGYDIWGGWRDNLDWDEDGLTNVYELFYGLDPSDPSDGADDPDGDFLTNYEESLAYTHPQLAFTVVDFVAENRLPSILVLDANGEPVLDAESNPVYRHPVNDYEGYFGQDFATATAHLIRDNGPDPAREQDDDWDGDSLSNYEELYHSGTNPREAEAPIALELSPSGGWLGEVEPGGYVSLAFGAAGGTPPYAWSASVPAWLELNPTTGEIQGAVPQDSSPGNLSLSVTLTDALGQSLTGQFDLEILSPPTTSCQCLGSSCHCSESGQCQEMCGDGGGGGGGGPVPPIDCGCLASGCPGSSCSGCGGQCAATPCECSNGDCNASVCADNSAVCLGGCVTPPTGCTDPQCACTRDGGICPAGCPGNCGGCDCGGGLCDQVCGTNNKSNGQNPCGTGGSCDDTHTQTPCTCGCGLESCAKEPGAEAAPCVCWCDCGCNEDASSLRKCGAPGPDDKCAAGSGQAPYPCSAASPSAEIKEVSFAGSNYHMLKSDDGNTSYNAPQWVDVNGDGSATTNATSGEKNYPVAFTRNTKPQIGGTFKVSGLPSGQTVKIRASSAQGLQIPETTVTSSTNGTIIMPPTTASNTLVDSIQFYNAEDNTAFKIDWEISIGSSAWRALGSTNHTVYITMADPIKTAAGLMRETLFNIGCRNAKGMGSVTQAVVDAIYDDFRDMNVQKVKPSSGTLDGIGMMYWNDPPTAGFATADLLSSGDGRCGAWTRMFTDVLRSQGIDAQITAFYAPLPNLQMIIPAIQAKYPNYQGQITVEFGNPAQPQPLILVKNWDLGNNFAPIDSQGIPAQTNANPQAFFGDHVVVEFGGKYYDPSYGSNVFESQQAWEDAALDGFGLIIFANPALPDQAQSNPALPQGVTIWMWKSDLKGSAETILHTINY